MTIAFFDSIIIFLVSCLPTVSLLVNDDEFSLFFPGSVWQVSPVAGSPPSSSVAFSSIIESQEIENMTLKRYG